jgi:Ras-related GTP-binding protein C/D
MYFELLVHKKEALPEDYQHDLMRIINDRLGLEVEDFFTENGVQLDDVVRVHATSIYDHSLWHAFSLIAQRGIEETYQLAQCVDAFKSNTAFTKVFIFDVATRLYLAMDSEALDVEDYALAWDYLNTLRQMFPLYK